MFPLLRKPPNHFHLRQPKLLSALTTTPPAPAPEQSADPTTTLASLILTSTYPRALTQTLHCPRLQWTPQLVDQILKRLWNHPLKALHFFNILSHHPTYTHSLSSFDHAVDLAARLRDYKTVWTLVHRMKSLRLGPTPKTFAIIAERGKFKADVVSYNVIANGWCLVKRTNKALEVLKEMVDRGLDPNLTTYNIVLKGYFRAGQIEEAWRFFLEMKKRKCEIDVVTYTTVVHGFGVVGEIRRARNVFDGMIKEGVLPSVATYNALIQVLCKKDSVENAILVFEEMVRKGYVPNLITYNVVIRGLCHAGEMERAMEFMGRMKDDECEPNVQTYNILIRYFCDVGEIESGLELFQKMGSGVCLPNLDTYNILINSMFVRKKSDDLLVAGKLLIEMVDRGYMPRKFTFNRVLNGLLLTGNQGLATQILRLQSRCGRLPRQFKL